MGFNRRKLEDQRREAARKEAAKRRATDAQVLEDAERLITAWNERQAKRMPKLFSPTVGAAITARYWFLWVRCPACRTVNAIDLRTLDRHHDAAVSSLIPALSCRSCRPNAPFAELVRLSPNEHRRRNAGRTSDGEVQSLQIIDNICNKNMFSGHFAAQDAKQIDGFCVRDASNLVTGNIDFCRRQWPISFGTGANKFKRGCYGSGKSRNSIAKEKRLSFWRSHQLVVPAALLSYQNVHLSGSFI